MAKIRNIRLGKFKYSFSNIKEFIPLYLGIYLLRVYSFNSDKKDPLIIDCGSHIGMSVLFFKKDYPKSKIIAFEPNPDTFKILEKNMKQNNITNVKLINAAVGNKEGFVSFYVSKKGTSSWGDSLFDTWSVEGKTKKIKVRSEILSKYINREIDLLKLNIEFSETLVMREIKDKLKNIKEIIIQYHGNEKNKDNNLNEIFDILDNNSYTLEIKQFGGLGIFRNVTRSTINKSRPYFLFIRAKRKAGQ